MRGVSAHDRSLAARWHLHEKHRGVYAVGHRTVSDEARWLAAVKACGDDAVLSHYSAAACWELVDWDGRPPEVTVPDTQRRKHPGIRIHRSGRVERTQHKGIAIAPPLRVLDDLAPRMPFIPLRRAVRQAYNLHLVDTAQLARARSRVLRAIAADLVPTRNLLEDFVHDLIREAGFEEPDVNVTRGCDVPDFRWAARGLIVEADGARHPWQRPRPPRRRDAHRPPRRARGPSQLARGRARTREDGRAVAG